MPAFVLHRKVKAVVFAALAVIVVDIGQQITDLYPNNPYLGVLRIIIPAIAGYLTSAEKSA